MSLAVIQEYRVENAAEGSARRHFSQRRGIGRHMLLGARAIHTDEALTGQPFPLMLWVRLSPRFDYGRDTATDRIGLAISRMIVEHHAGQIRVLFSRGSGAKFQVILPVNKANAG